jgi:hypothetical protein
VDTPPNTLFGANLWMWLNPTNIATPGGLVYWGDASGNNRYVQQTGAGPTVTTIGSLAAVDFTTAAGQGLTNVSSDPNWNLSLGGQTQITVWGVASFRSPTAAYGGFAAYGSTNTASSYDAGSAWLGVQRNNTNDELLGAKDAGGGGPAIAISPSATVYRFCTVWTGTEIYFYINNVLQAGYPVSLVPALTGPGPPTGLERMMVGAGISGGGALFYWDGKLGEFTMVVGMVPSAYQLACYDLNLKNKFGL